MNRRTALSTALAAAPMAAAVAVGAYPMLASVPAPVVNPLLARRLEEVDAAFGALSRQMRELGYSTAALEHVHKQQVART